MKKKDLLITFLILIIILLMPADPRNGNTGSVIGNKRVGRTLITK